MCLLLDVILYAALGIVAPFFLPGFAWSFVFFGKKDVWSLERIMISIGLSIAIVPLTLLLLNQLLGVGITLLNVTVIITILVAIAASVRLVETRITRVLSEDE